MKPIRTDLAIEAHEMLTEAATEPVGVTINREDRQGAHVTRIGITTPEGEQQLGKPMGHYVTVEFAAADLGGSADYEALCRAVADELAALLPVHSTGTVLVVGLGNRDITPDALGPKVISQLMVTRHLFDYLPEAIDEHMRSVCAISPGVLGITGIETGEVVRGVTESVHPDAVIVVDALAARSIERISTTIQLCDTGISPGAGVGNRRKALNRDTLGIPVIAVGVPTVIDAVTIAIDSLQLAAENQTADNRLRRALKGFDRDEQHALLRDALPEAITDFIVTPKDVDLLIDRVSKVVANGINLALHPGIGFDDIAAYTG